MRVAPTEIHSRDSGGCSAIDNRTGIPGPRQGAGAVGCHGDHRRNDPGLSHLCRGGVCATRGAAPHAGAAALGDGRPDRHRRRADLRRTGNDVSRGGRTIRLHQTGLRPPVGFSLRLDLVARDPGGSQRVSRRGVRRVSRSVHSVLFLDARDRLDSAGTLDMGSRTPRNSRAYPRSRCCRQ